MNHKKDVKIFLNNKKAKSAKRLKTNIKIFLQNKKQKKRLYHPECNKNLFEQQKRNKVEDMRNYYLAHKKWILSCFVVFFGSWGN